MKKKRGFTLKSGNNIVGKGRKPSNFKIMGASPAKQDDVVMAGLLPEVEIKDEKDKIAYEDADPNYVQAGSELKGQERKDYMAKTPYGGMKGVTQTLKRENFKNRLMADNSEASIKQFEREFPGETHPANK